ncbi:hypothetical protein HDU89_001142 [Geranomyces variabilis]|nr:hypothetical protein HDU89_001142 [Geranomyces variabilis]
MAIDSLELANAAIENLQLVACVLLAVTALKFTLDNSARLGKLITLANALHLGIYIILIGFYGLNRDLDFGAEDLGVMTDLFSYYIDLFMSIDFIMSVDLFIGTVWDKLPIPWGHH